MSCDTGLFQAAEPSQDALSYSIDALAHFIREATLNTAGIKRRHSKVISGSDYKVSDRAYPRWFVAATAVESVVIILGRVRDLTWCSGATLRGLEAQTSRSDLQRSCFRQCGQADDEIRSRVPPRLTQSPGMDHLIQY